MSPKSPENISNFEGWGLTLVAYKKISVIYKIHAMFGSIRSQLFFKKNVLKNFAKVTEKYLRWSLLFIIKLLAFRPATLLKKTPSRCFSMNIVQILRTAVFIEHLWWLLLTVLMVVKQDSNFDSETTTVWLFLNCYMTEIKAVHQSRCSKLCKFHRKAPVLESLFNKVASPRDCNFIKKRLQHRCFPAKFASFLRTPFFSEKL